ncbi:hypothetical protein M758_8G101800 [Ceratodon purpureus]|nr:hypothetical protein M758_8G101800 [Ceratodon purpureus]
MATTLSNFNSWMHSAPTFSESAALDQHRLRFEAGHAFDGLRKATPNTHRQHFHRPLYKPTRRLTNASKGCRSRPLKSVHEELAPAHDQYFAEKPPTPLLDTVNLPVHVKNLNLKDLQQLADEVRTEIKVSVLRTGGHLGSGLGVVDLTVALHHVFNAPEDHILWDAEHQTYPHKILTGRRNKMFTMSKNSELAGFTKRAKSDYDPFGAGHGSTIISAGLGMAVARDLEGRSNSVVAVIGDGAMTAGQVYEAINNAGYLDSNLIIILNDHNQVIDSLPTTTPAEPAPTPLIRPLMLWMDLEFSQKLPKSKEALKNVTNLTTGSYSHQIAAKMDELARAIGGELRSTLFKELGVYYIGPVDGHNLEDLITVLRSVKSIPAHGPVLIHVVTKKGHGYSHAERVADKYHDMEHFDPATGKRHKTEPEILSYTQCFENALIVEAEADSNIVAIHAAMGGETGLHHFEKKFPERTFGVGIAEQHAVTFAAGLATEGLRPFCAISSSLLQRGYDQVVHDVDLQKLPVRFAMDSAGLVGADGPTHCGAFDVTYMACLPNMVVMAAADEAELIHMVATSAAIEDRPSCFRFPRGNGLGVPLPLNFKGTPLEIGKGRVLIEGTRVAILGYGSVVQNCSAAHSILASLGVSATVADARFCKPLDGELITRLAKEHKLLITVEEGSVGGFSAHVAHFLAVQGLLDSKLQWRPMVLPDRYIDQGSPNEQIEEARLSGKHIAAMVLDCLGLSREAALLQA